MTSFSATEAGTTVESNTIAIVDGSPIAPAFVSTPVTAATIGEPYAYDADATGSPSPTYALATPPAGMTINSYTGLVQWTPSAAGSYAVTATATNTAGTATQPYTLVVSAGPVPEIENLALTSTSGFDLTTDDLTCGFDLASTATTAATAWYVGAPTLAPLMAFYLPMEGGAAYAAKDYSGNGITAVVNGNPVWSATAGHDGKGAWVLDGSDDLSGGENFPVGSSYSITAWVYRTGSGNNGGNNVVAGNDNTGGHAFWAPDMFGNKLSAGHNGTWNSVQDPVVLALNTWFFVSLTYNSDTEQMVLYKNGSPVSSATVTAPVTDATISVGSFGYSNGFMWKGTLDDVRIYKRALSAEQIASLYAAGENVIKHTETEVGDSWQARVTPFSATDAGSTYESNTIVIQGAAVPPEITSTPVTDAAIGELYTYDVEATGNPAPEYLLWVNPAGMTIDETTGLIEWTPSASGNGSRGRRGVQLGGSGHADLRDHGAGASRSDEPRSHLDVREIRDDRRASLRVRSHGTGDHIGDGLVHRQFAAIAAHDALSPRRGRRCERAQGLLGERIRRDRAREPRVAPERRPRRPRSVEPRRNGRRSERG